MTCDIFKRVERDGGCIAVEGQSFAVETGVFYVAGASDIQFVALSSSVPSGGRCMAVDGHRSAVAREDRPSGEEWWANFHPVSTRGHGHSFAWNMLLPVVFQATVEVEGAAPGVVHRYAVLGDGGQNYTKEKGNISTYPSRGLRK